MKNQETPIVFTHQGVMGMNDTNVHPLGQVNPVVIRKKPVHVDGKGYLNSLGLFGTAGDPNVIPDWRRNIAMPRMEETLALYGLEKSVRIFNPLKAEWKPSDAAVESYELARDATIIAPVLDLTQGFGSLGETGFAALAGTLRSQQVSLFIESGSNLGDQTVRSRVLTSMLAKQTVEDFPSLGVRLAPTFDILIERGIDDAVGFANRASGRVIASHEFLIPQRLDLNPNVALVGSGASVYNESWYEGMAWRLDNFGLNNEEVFQAYKSDWTMDDAYNELQHKTNDAVVLFAVTHDQDSYGAIGELGWLITYCMLNSQRLGIYVERHDSDPKSDQNRQRTLAMAHLGRLLADFPDLPVYIASTPQELASFGAVELAKYKQKSLAFGSSQLL